MLAGAVVAAKEREHSVQYGPDFVNLVGLVHGLLHLIDQTQEDPKGNEAIVFPEARGVCDKVVASLGNEAIVFPEARGVCDKVVASPLPVALIPWFDHALLHLKPQAEECFQLGDSDGLKVLGVV